MYYTYLHRKKDTNEIFYVGKGICKRKRANSHANRNQHWKNTVTKHGLLVEIVASWKNEKDAFLHEKFLIACFLEMGIKLTNQTSGGDGTSGWKHTEQYKKWKSDCLKEEYKDPVKRAKKANAQKRRFESVEERKRHSEKVKNAWTDEKRKKASETQKNLLKTKQHSCQRMNDQILQQMQKLRANGLTYIEIAKITGFHKTNVGLFLRKAKNDSNSKIQLFQKQKAPDERSKFALPELLH
jgi:monoamine oxidase